MLHNGRRLRKQEQVWLVKECPWRRRYSVKSSAVIGSYSGSGPFSSQALCEHYCVPGEAPTSTNSSLLRETYQGRLRAPLSCATPHPKLPGRRPFLADSGATTAKQKNNQTPLKPPPCTSYRMPSMNHTGSDSIQVVLAPYDRVAIGGELLLFKWKALETPDAGPIPTAEEAVMEFKRAIQVTRVLLRECLPERATLLIKLYHNESTL